MTDLLYDQMARLMLEGYKQRRDDNGNINEFTIDPNANRGVVKHHKGIVADTIKPLVTKFNQLLLNEYIDDLGDIITGKQFWKNEASGDYYFHDRTQLVPYCWAVSLTRLIQEKTIFGRLASSPMKRLGSYISAVSDIVDQMSYHVAGAVGLGTLFPDMAMIAIEKMGISAVQLETDDRTRYMITNLFQQLVHSVNHESRGDESPFTNVSLFGKFILEKYFEKNPKKDELVRATIALQKIYCLFYTKGDPMEGGAPYTFPISTFNATSPYEDDFVRWAVSNIDITRFNFFFTTEPKVASCCRYINNIELMEDHGKESNSFASGFGGLGSHRVITQNLPRIAFESETVYEFVELLEKRVCESVVVLKAHKDFVIDMGKRGIYHPINRGWVNPNRMFSTIGLTGMPEAQMIAESKDWDVDIIQISIQTIQTCIEQLAVKYNLALNTEEVPGETATIRLADLDREKFGHNLPYYSNQFFPLYKATSPDVKLGIEGAYLEQLTGGGITLYQVAGKIKDPESALALLQMAYDKKCCHLAISTTYSVCENHHTIHGNHEVCSVCGGKIIDKIAKPCGYNQRYSAWWTERLKRDQLTRYEYAV